jgi:hypothetical protein
MNEDPLLASLAQLARQQEEADSAVEAALLEPLSPSLKDQIAQRALTALTRASPSPAKVIRPPRWRRRALVAVPLALTGMLAVWLASPRATAPLPAYRLSLGGAVSPLRSSAPAEGVLALRPESRVELILRPDSQVTGTVGVQLFLIGSNRAPAQWPVHAELSEDGAFRVSGTASELFPASQNEWELAVVIGRPSDLSPRYGEQGPSAQLLKSRLKWQ